MLLETFEEKWEHWSVPEFIKFYNEHGVHFALDRRSADRQKGVYRQKSPTPAIRK